MARGRPFEPGNTFGKGRPRGSRNKTTKAALELINSHAESVMRKIFVMALQGDVTMLRALLDRIVPVRRETSVNIGQLRTTTVDDLAKAYEELVKRTTSGRLSITEANGLADLLEKKRKLFETEELERRIRALESKG
jgi:hypothetical protein